MLIDDIVVMDSLEFLKSLEDNSVDLIVTSPPYNKGWWSKNRSISGGIRTKSRHIDYGVFDDKMNPEDYEKWQRERLLKSA